MGESINNHDGSGSSGSGVISATLVPIPPPPPYAPSAPLHAQSAPPPVAPPLAPPLAPLAIAQIVRPLPPSPPPRTAVPYIAADVLPHSARLPLATLLHVSHPPDGDCRICRRPFSSMAAAAKLHCGHVFHRPCIEASLRHLPACPTCGDVRCIEPPYGTSPSGTLHHSLLRDRPCPGVPDAPSTILLEYRVPDGVQKPYHPRPGRRFEGFSLRRAFLPDNPAGRAILARVIYAWKRGLVFTVGTSATTGRSDAVVWSSLVPHKTSLQGGPHGWPDGAYLRACREALDALRVPDAEECERRAECESASGSEHREASAMRMVVLPLLATEEIAYDADKNDDNATAKVAQTEGLQPISRFPHSKDTCRICGKSLASGFCVEIQACRHAFHQKCLENKLLRGVDRCSVCGVSYGRPRGHSPSGTMTIDRDPRLCPGFEPAKTIRITYRIPPGIQKSHHPHPGRRHEGTIRTAYLPNDDEGIRLLQRLRCAWTRGLIFTVGYSVTSRRNDCVTWATIPHKTRLEKGAYGFPDPCYVDDCHRVLDGLLVP